MTKKKGKFATDQWANWILFLSSVDTAVKLYQVSSQDFTPTSPAIRELMTTCSASISSQTFRKRTASHIKLRQVISDFDSPGRIGLLVNETEGYYVVGVDESVLFCSWDVLHGTFTPELAVIRGVARSASFSGAFYAWLEAAVIEACAKSSRAYRAKKSVYTEQQSTAEMSSPLMEMLMNSTRLPSSLREQQQPPPSRAPGAFAAGRCAVPAHVELRALAVLSLIDAQYHQTLFW
ncbi:hypothetical protein GALMADRAFT_134085 [Galerina marginata CBS 339.88]|uniref:Uncharacterized protein n=1 Tax=Galerina marginata (strain CBS 339.88) TaxID=685588 RepID=A0A067TRG3_GALM3|nr:hypothetical protein GALMADRAFT_134085 [Galerina marginata CBS 339.88]